MTRVLQYLSNWKIILPLFLAFCFFTFYLFLKYQNHLFEIAGQEVNSLDTRFSYSVNDVQNYFNALGDKGRKEYEFIVGQIDMFYPVIYALLFILVLAYLLKNIAVQNRKIILFSLIPLVGVLFDYLENFNTLELLELYPDISDELVSKGELLTRMKHIFLLFSLLLIIILGLKLLMMKIKNRPGNLVK